MSNARIGGVESSSMVDWKGHVVLLIFAAGCNFRCGFCHNSGLLDPNSGNAISISEMVGSLEKELFFADAVGLTGGEPCLQPRLVNEVFSWSRRIGCKTFLNTNGSCPQVVRDLAEDSLVDYLAIDLKAPLRNDLYCAVAGVSQGFDRIVDRIKETMEICTENGVQFEARTTIIPQLVDGESTVREIAGAVTSASSYVLQQYSPSENVLDERLRRVPSPSREHLLRLGSAALDEGLENVYIRTRERGLERVEQDG